MTSLSKMTRLGLPLTMAALLLTGGACNKSAGSTNPGEGKSAEQIEAERKAAVEQAKAAGLIDLANQELQSGRYVSARQRAEEALATNPNDADAYAVLGAAAWRGGDFTASTDAYRKALELDPNNFGAIDGLGRNLQAAGKHAESMELQDKLIAAEGEGFQAASCDAETECEMGWCDQQAGQCQPTRQARPRINKLWSQYLMLDAEAAAQTGDEIFVGSTATADESALVAPFVEFIRPLVGKGPFIQIEGTSATSDLDIDPVQGLKHFSATVGGEYSRTVFFELLNEARISPELADQLKLERLGKVRPFAMPNELDIVIVPEIKIGDLTIKNIPAFVDDLSPFATIGETPGMLLGRQVMQRFGAITFDFPGGSLALSVDAPADPPAGAADRPLLVIDSLALRVPVTEISIDGSEHGIWTWIGGTWQAAVALSGKAYLKSGHRPSEIDPPDDPDQGLKMVYVDDLAMGDVHVRGMGGYILTNTPPDPTIAAILEGTGFELGGYVNIAAMKLLKVTYLLPQGRMWVQKAPAAG